MSVITKYEHNVIAHVLNFVRTANIRAIESKIKDLDVDRMKIIDLIDKLRDKLDHQFFKCSGIHKKRESPYYGWSDELALSEYGLDEMNDIVQQSKQNNLKNLLNEE